MDRIKTAEKIISEYIKPIYGFALKRTASVQDAEDLSQEILAKVYHTLCIRDDIKSIEHFIWAVAKNTVANYYRNKTRMGMGFNIDDLSDTLEGDSLQPLEQIIEAENISRLKQEIAYLSKIQRNILILYYFNNKKQNEIAELLGIPLGTVKWHLSEAKTELKKGLVKVRTTSDLGFNPIKFNLFGMSGSSGSLGNPGNLFRSALSHNIIYSIYYEPKSIEAIADTLRVSPVYIESELGFLTEYGLVTEKAGKYLANILIDEINDKLINAHDELYSKAARLLADRLFDRLMESNLTNIQGLHFPDKDMNFLMWGLVPYLLACTNSEDKDRKIKFDEVAVFRPDGGHNIITACIIPDDYKKDRTEKGLTGDLNFGSMYGPLWNSDSTLTIWEILGTWTDRTMDEYSYQKNMEVNLKLMGRFLVNAALSSEEYARLIEQGYINKTEDHFKPVVVFISDMNTLEELKNICKEVKQQSESELKALRENYCSQVLNVTPKHLQKMREFSLQSIFDSDGDFMKHSINELVKTNRLRSVSSSQRKSVSIVIVMN
jgi:RNA polymerase sigma factor (sigma-70 family)